MKNKHKMGRDVFLLVLSSFVIAAASSADVNSTSIDVNSTAVKSPVIIDPSSVDAADADYDAVNAVTLQQLQQQLPQHIKQQLQQEPEQPQELPQQQPQELPAQQQQLDKQLEEELSQEQPQQLVQQQDTAATSDNMMYTIATSKKYICALRDNQPMTAVFADIHDADRKRVSIMEDQLVIEPYGSEESWVVYSHVDTEHCNATVDFRVPGKPNPPPGPLTMTAWTMATAMPSRHKASFEFTDPSGVMDGPLNVWVMVQQL